MIPRFHSQWEVKMKGMVHLLVLDPDLWEEVKVVVDLQQLAQEQGQEMDAHLKFPSELFITTTISNFSDLNYTDTSFACNGCFVWVRC